ncbi:hypothetical protein GCM10022220_08740 [Actinocatenispora rupis]|uniref:Transcriptional regulator, IclR family n=2 Tax=Actinocatenispora rupis TaxID=519421 RepID=A0A8J3J845_9ACTN|nr:hypothetical protein Aru02nite_10170 [Actinocatenispora rupis]
MTQRFWLTAPARMRLATGAELDRVTGMVDGTRDPTKDGRVAQNNVGTGSSVAGRIFLVLDAFVGAEGSLRLTDIAGRTGLPMPTALRMVRELVAWGGLARLADGSYRLGEHIWALGSLSPCLRRQRDLARPFLHELAGKLGGAAELAVREGTEALIVDQICAPTVRPGHRRLDTRVPLYATGVGRVLLAHAPGTVLREVSSGGFTRFTAFTVDSAARLSRHLERIRTGGIARVHEELRLGAVSVAAPVRHPELGVIAAIGVVVPTTTPTARVESAVRAAGNRLSTAMAAASAPEVAGPSRRAPAPPARQGPLR